jgi:hypothetical protein
MILPLPQKVYSRPDPNLIKPLKILLITPSSDIQIKCAIFAVSPISYGFDKLSAMAFFL